jgi:hypothetical protein
MLICAKYRVANLYEVIESHSNSLRYVLPGLHILRDNQIRLPKSPNRRLDIKDAE